MTTLTFAVSSSGALITRAFGKIIREKAKLIVAVHEHWDFETSHERFGVIGKGIRDWYLGAGEAVVKGFDPHPLQKKPLVMRALARKDERKSEQGYDEFWILHWWARIPQQRLKIQISCEYSLNTDHLEVIELNIRNPTIAEWFEEPMS